MSLTHSFKLPLLVPLFLALPHRIAADEPDSIIVPVGIQNIRADTSVDLYTLYNGAFSDFEDVAGETICWDVVTSSGVPIPDAFTTWHASVELMAGPPEANGTSVTDFIGLPFSCLIVLTAFSLVAGLHINDTSCAQYWFPANLELGIYHIRVNSTTNTTRSSGNVIKELTARSAAINVTTSIPPGCGAGKTPDPFTPVPSNLSSSYTSLIMRYPNAGTNVLIDPNNTNPVLNILLNVEWAYRDARNAFGVGISNLTIQVLDNNNGSNVGPLQTPTSQDANSVTPLHPLKQGDIPLQAGGSYKLRIQYQNSIPDGSVSPGGLVTFVSPEFNMVLEDTNCTAPDASGSNSTSPTGGPGSPPPNKASAATGLKAPLFGQLLAVGLAIVVGFVYLV